MLALVHGKVLVTEWMCVMTRLRLENNIILFCVGIFFWMIRHQLKYRQCVKYQGLFILIMYMVLSSNHREKCFIHTTTTMCRKI